MLDIILIAKVLFENTKKKKLVIDTLDVKVTWECNSTNILLKYNCYLDSIDIKVVVDLRLQSVKKS